MHDLWETIQNCWKYQTVIFEPGLSQNIAPLLLLMTHIHHWDFKKVSFEKIYEAVYSFIRGLKMEGSVSQLPVLELGMGLWQGCEEVWFACGALESFLGRLLASLPTAWSLQPFQPCPGAIAPDHSSALPPGHSPSTAPPLAARLVPQGAATPASHSWLLPWKCTSSTNRGVLEGHTLSGSHVLGSRFWLPRFVLWCMFSLFSPVFPLGSCLAWATMFVSSMVFCHKEATSVSFVGFLICFYYA